MDLGLEGRSALVTAASEGLGRAIATALAGEGVDMTIVARRPDVLEAAAASIREQTGAKVVAVAADITTPEGRQRALEVSQPVDILVNSIGGHPPGDFDRFTIEDWREVVEAMMLTPIELMKATLPGMVGRRFGRVINVTSMGMRVPMRIHPLSNGARGGLTAFVSTVAADYVADNVTINNILPGPHATDRMKVTMRHTAQEAGRTEEEEYQVRLGDNPAHRFGHPEDLGALAAFLCSEQAGYMTGQNLLIDGGQGRTTF
ncbi:MAG TPA: SDR family oxidoreductase [Solirubrobacterales bacterium]